jgi:hypothetical protein
MVFIKSTPWSELLGVLYAYFVTRAKDNMVYEILGGRKVDPGAGLISDQTIRLTSIKTSSKYPETLRLVMNEDFSTGVVYTPNKPRLEIIP